MRSKKRINVLILLLIVILLPQKLGAIEPLETLKTLKDTALGLGEAILGKKLPKTIAVLPATGEGDEQEKNEIRTTFSNHISYKNYDQQRLSETDAKLHIAIKATGKTINQLTPQELGKYLKVDGLVYVHIVGIEKVYAALYASLTLKLKVKLVNADTGETIWEKEDSVTERSGGVPTSPWGAISTAVTSAMVLRESVKISLVDKLCRSLAKEMPEPKVTRAKKLPVIFSVLTNALDGPFKQQDEILVSLRGEEGLTAYFDIGDVRKAIMLSEIKPGEYVGKYVVTEGDNWNSKTVTAYLYNPREKLESRYIVPYGVTVDTIPPQPVTDPKITFQQEGFHLYWTPPKDEDVKDFVIYRATIDNPDFIEIATTSLPEYLDKDIEFGKKYYYRIFARDRAKNISKSVELTKVAVKQGPTYITGQIRENTFFYAAGSPYILKGNIEVTKNSSLTVEEGAVIIMENNSTLSISGKLYLEGKKDAIVTVKGSDYSIILKDSTKDAFRADYTYFIGGKRFVISNACATFSNTTFEDFNIALIIDKNSNVNISRAIFRKNKAGIKVTDSVLDITDIEISGSEKAMELTGNVALRAKNIKMKNNNLHISSENPIELPDLEVSESESVELIKKIYGQIEIKQLKPFGKNFSSVKNEFIENLKREFAVAILKDSLKEAKEKVELLKELSLKDFYDLVDPIAYLYYKNGEKEKAKDLLTKATPKAQKELEKVLNDAGKGDITILFTDIKMSIGQTADGVERGAITKAKWRAVKSFVEDNVADLDREKLVILNDKIIPKSSEYVLNIVPLCSQMTDMFYNGYYMVFLDKNRLMDTLKEYRLAGENYREIKIAVVDCTALGFTKNRLLNTLKKLSFEFVEYGTGSCEPSNYYEKAKAANIDLIVVISETSRVAPSLLGGNLKNIQATVELKGYDALVGKPVFNLTKGTNIYHMNDEEGKEIAIRNAFEKLSERLEREILSLEKSFSADENRKKSKKAFYAEKHLPPLEIKVEKSEVIFANDYKSYAERPFIEITINNNTSQNIELIKVFFTIKDFMDFPTEKRIDKLDALSSQTLKLTAVFNNKLLELTESSTIQSDITVKFVKDGVEKQINTTHPIEVYEKHALVWNDRDKISIFVTPKDPIIVDFSRNVSRSVKKKVFSKNFTLGLAVFEAMRSIGIIYQQDPTSPYQLSSGKTDTIDYVQYPRETLKRRTGDCDDLVVLFLSIMGSLGVKAQAIDFPGHILAMFEAGIEKEDIDKIGIKRDLVVIYDNKVYIPVELTLLSENFYKAWMKGVDNYNANIGRGLRIVELEKAWQTYKPATLPPETLNIQLPNNYMNFYNSAYENCLNLRNDVILKNINQKLTIPEQALYLTYNTCSTEDALILGKYLIENGIDSSSFFNDLGNLYYLEKKYIDALQYYKKALEKESDNPFYIKNILLALQKTGERGEIKNYKSKLKRLAPFLLED